MEYRYRKTSFTLSSSTGELEPRGVINLEAPSSRFDSCLRQYRPSHEVCTLAGSKRLLHVVLRRHRVSRRVKVGSSPARWGFNSLCVWLLKPFIHIRVSPSGRGQQTFNLSSYLHRRFKSSHPYHKERWQRGLLQQS